MHAQLSRPRVSMREDWGRITDALVPPPRLPAGGPCPADPLPANGVANGFCGLELGLCRRFVEPGNTTRPFVESRIQNGLHKSLVCHWLSKSAGFWWATRVSALKRERVRLGARQPSKSDKSVSRKERFSIGSGRKRSCMSLPEEHGLGPPRVLRSTHEPA